MRSKILDHIDFQTVNVLLHGFNKLTGFVTAIEDLEGNVLSQSGWREICTEFHRKNPDTAQKCKISDVELANEIRKDQKFHFYKCMNGLVDVVVPIVINGEHIANLFTGQFFFEESEFSFFKKQAKTYGFDENAYLEALAKVPVFSEEKVEEVMDFLLNITQIIIKMTHDKLYQIEINEELRKREANYNTLIDTTRDGFWVVDIKGRIIDVNETYCQMTGYTKTELLGMKIEDLEALETSQETIEHIKHITEYKSDMFETRHKKKDGSILDIEVSATFVDSDAGIYAFCRDITERKNFEHDIKLSEEKFQLLFNKAPLGYQSLDFEGRFIEVNQKWLETLGYSKAEVVGKWFGDFLCPEYVDGFRQRFPIFKSQGYIHSEFEMLHKDGQRLFIAFEGKIAYNSEGAFKQTHCILQDITDQRKVEKALIESEAKYRRITETISDAIWTTDLDLNITYVSPSIESLMGESVQAHLARSMEEKFPPDSLAEIQLVLAEEFLKDKDPMVDKNRSRVIEIRQYRADGSIIWISMHVTFLRDENGEITGFQGVSRDITELKKTENELFYLSYHDHLTGLYNRRYFEIELKKIDTPRNLPISIIMIDINGLKLVNDSFGHDSGDNLLKKAATTIRNACRKGDIFARVGGDEFLILLPKTTADETVKIANQIKQLASNEKVSNFELSISYGYDTKTNDKQSIIEVMANAENHMYRHKLYERSSMRSKMIDLIMNALFEKSNRELLHSNRVSALCKAIATKMNLDKDVVDQLGIAGLIHDIGKIGIDEKILNKTELLTDDERKDIEKHPEIGWRLLSSTDEFSELGQLVLNHHEKWDGSGYPTGLKGTEIPIEARILVVADAYDAMTSERSYRKGISREEAIEELKRCSGTHFDPEIVDLFVDQILKDNKSFEFEQY